MCSNWISMGHAFILFLIVDQLENFVVYVTDEPVPDDTKICHTETGSVSYLILEHHFKVWSRKCSTSGIAL